MWNEPVTLLNCGSVSQCVSGTRDSSAMSGSPIQIQISGPRSASGKLRTLALLGAIGMEGIFAQRPDGSNSMPL